MRQNRRNHVLNMPDITITYRDHVIEYNETNNEWVCDSFEHRRGSPSLTLAKARVDKIIDGPDEKSKPFERVDVWTNRFGYDREWKKITLTSKAEGGYWATDGKERKKLSRHDVENLCADTLQNAARVAKIDVLHAQIDGLREDIAKIEQQLTKFKP